MTSLTLNTPGTSANAILSLPVTPAFGKNINTPESYFSYSILPERKMRNSAFHLSSIDWDLNMNELEFE